MPRPLSLTRTPPSAMQRDVDGVGIAGQRLVDRVVDDLPDEVVQAALAGGPDVHAGRLRTASRPSSTVIRKLPPSKKTTRTRQPGRAAFHAATSAAEVKHAASPPSRSPTQWLLLIAGASIPSPPTALAVGIPRATGTATAVMAAAAVRREIMGTRSSWRGVRSAGSDAKYAMELPTSTPIRARRVPGLPVVGLAWAPPGRGRGIHPSLRHLPINAGRVS
jgi:hypothetical protein